MQCVEVQSKKKSNSLFVQAISLQKGPSKAFLFYSSFRPTRTEPSLRGKGKKRRREFEKGPSPRALALSFCRPPPPPPERTQASVSARLPHTRHGRRTEVVIPSHFFPVTASDIKQKVEEEKRICLCSKLRRRLATSSSVISGKLQTHEGGGLLCSGFRRSSSRVSASLGRSDPKKW